MVSRGEATKLGAFGPQRCIESVVVVFLSGGAVCVVAAGRVGGMSPWLFLGVVMELTRVAVARILCDQKVTRGFLRRN